MWDSLTPGDHIKQGVAVFPELCYNVCIQSLFVLTKCDETSQK